MAKEYASERVSVESRPEYITRENMAEMRDILGDLEIDMYMGVESTNDFVRKYNHHKLDPNLSRRVTNDSSRRLRLFFLSSSLSFS